MNILKISTLDTKGGGSKIPWNILLGMRGRGHDVSMFVGWKCSADPQVYELPKNPLYYRLSKYLANDLTFSRSGRIFKSEAYKKADIVHFHNIHSGFFNWSTFKRIVREKKCVWTVHDLWPFTPGCTTSFDCKRDRPARVLGFLWDNRPWLLAQKKKVYEHSRFHIVAPSLWMDGQLSHSILQNMPRQMVANGVNTDVFKPRNKQFCRRELGLPLDKKIVLFVANNGLKNRLKGGNHLLDMARSWESQKNIVFVIVGERNVSEPETDLPPNIIRVGDIKDEKLIAPYYSAADVFAYPTLADSFGLVVAESMACGTPVASFRTDGVPDIIGDCGYLAECGDTVGLAAQIKKVLSLTENERSDLSEKCVMRIRTHYSLDRMIDEYAALYSDVLKEPLNEVK